MNRPPPRPLDAPPPYAFVGRIYKRSLRPIVIACCSVSAVWSFLWGASALQDISSTNDFNKYDIAFGALYITVGMIEVFGTVAAVKQSLPLMRIFTFLSVFGAMIVLATESMRLSIYFTNKTALINECTTESTGNAYISWASSWNVPSYLTAEQAREWCHDRWSRGVWSSIASLVVIGLLGWFFSSIAFSYYHQLLSPQAIAPSEAFRLGQVRSQQPGGPPFAPYNPQSGYQYPGTQQEDYVPPYDPHKVPDYYAGPDAKDGAVGPEKDAAAYHGPSSSTTGLGYTGGPGGDLGDRTRNV